MILWHKTFWKWKQLDALLHDEGNLIKKNTAEKNDFFPNHRSK